MLTLFNDAGNQQHDAEMVISKALMLCDAFAVEIHSWREAHLDQVRTESEEIIAASRRKHAVGCGLSEASFEAIQEAFDAFSPVERRTTAVVDRSGLVLAQFAAVLRQLGAKKLAENAGCLFDVCYEARGSSLDGTAPTEKLIAACVALHSEVTNEERVAWLFETFSGNRRTLDLNELEEVIQLVSVILGFQWGLSPEPVVNEAQQWFIGSGWQAAWSKAFTDEQGANVANPGQGGEGVGWVVEVDLGLTDPNGWRYASSLPKNPPEGYHTSDYSTKEDGCYGRWRKWQNRGEDAVVACVGVDALSCSEFAAAVRSSLPGLHPAMCVLDSPL